MKEACIRIKNTPDVHTNYEWHFRSYESGVYTNEVCIRKRGLLCAILICAPFICVTRPIFMCVTLPIFMCGESHSYTRPIRYEGGVYTNQEWCNVFL